MRIGVRAHDYGKQEIEQLAAILHENGYGCAQLAVPKACAGIDSYAQITPVHLERIRRAFEENQVEISVFGCYMDLANPKEEIRRYAIDTIKKCLVYGREVGAKVIGTETSYSCLDAQAKKIWYPYMIDAVKEIVEEAARVDAKFALEPVLVHPLDSVEAVLDVFRQINDEQHLRMIFDPSNVLDASLVDAQDKYWTQWLQQTGKYIDAMHIKDFRFNEKGGRVSTTLGDGVMRYGVISEWLAANKKEIPLLREEMNPETAKQDMDFMKNL